MHLDVGDCSVLLLGNLTSDLSCIKIIYYMPSTFYIVKLQLALGNIFHWTESKLAQSQDGAKHPYWGINIDFWHCLIVMTYRNRALFRFYSFQQSRIDLRIVMRPCFPMYFTLDSGHKLAKCLKNKEWNIRTWNS